MYLKRLFHLILLGVLTMVMSGICGAASLTADEIMMRNFHVAKVGILRSDATMILINDKGQQRERKLASLSRLQDDGVNVDLSIRFDLPADVRGTRFLQIQHAERDDDMWIYLPALKRSRRLVSNNKRDSFVGSDFSYADILPLKPEMFRHVLLRTEVLNSQDCHVIESIPKNENLKNDLGYSKRISWIRKDNFVEAKVDYYDLNGQLFRTQNTDKHKQVESEPARWLALKREMVNYQTGHKTVIAIDSVDTRGAIPARAFTVEALDQN
jgi:hypothetical protein